MWLWWVGIVSLIVGVALGIWPFWRLSRRRREQQSALQSFRYEREQLEAKFLDLARQTGKPAGLRWSDCDWLDAVTFARDRKSGLLTAFVALNVRFEAIEGGEMEGVAAVSTIREAAAVFHYTQGRWMTGGRALFNMDPHDAIQRLSGQYEAVLNG